MATTAWVDGQFLFLILDFDLDRRLASDLLWILDFDFDCGFCYGFWSTEVGGVIEKLDGGGGGGGWLIEEEK